MEAFKMPIKFRCLDNLLNKLASMMLTLMKMMLISMTMVLTLMLIVMIHRDAFPAWETC